MEHDLAVLKLKMLELVQKEQLSYEDVYRLKLEMDVLIDEYYFECVG